MKKLFSAIVALILLTGAAANAAETPTLEVRKRNSIGRMGLIDAQISVKAEADGTLLVSFQAPGEGTYLLIYTSGALKGKTAKAIKVEKAGPVTTKIKG